MTIKIATSCPARSPGRPFLLLAARPTAPEMGAAMTQAMDHPTLDEAVDVDALIGAVAHDIAADPFPVKGLDHLRFFVGNAKQAAHYYSTGFGMTVVAYRGPEQGFRDHAEYVLTSGSATFVMAGPVHANAEAAIHHTKHGDGIVDIALEVPDVDKAYEFALSEGATGLEKPHDIEDANGVVRIASIAAYGDTRHSLIDRSRYTGPFL